MKKINLGTDAKTGKPALISPSIFDTHLHLIGGTGKGKTTALHTMLQSLMLYALSRTCFFIFDRLGNFSEELLLWINSDYCTKDVRDRVVYVEPAREDVVLGFNPLLYETSAHGYYKVQRATDIILRGWDSVNIEAMPRLARWTFNAFWAAAQLGLTIADCIHFLLPGTRYHTALLKLLPAGLQAEWAEIYNPRNQSHATQILDSTRNRLKPYFDSVILRRMFGTAQNRLDVARFMAEGKIVIVNLAPRDRLSWVLSDAIGGLILNEIFATARSVPRSQRGSTYLVLDEFQNFVGPDIEQALPEVRQLGLKLLLSHQSFSQLQRGDYDLTSMIFQAQSRMLFGVQGEDADILAKELASISYDPKRIKDELYTRRQLVKGHRKIELCSWNESQSAADNWQKQYGHNWSTSQQTSRQENTFGEDHYGTGRSSGSGFREGKGGSVTSATGRGRQEAILPVHDEFAELSNRTYYTFDEQWHLWAQLVRTLPTGTSLVRLVDDPTIREIAVKRSAPGYLGWDYEMLRRELPEVFDDLGAFLEQNFRSEFFVSPEVIDRETHDRLENLCNPKITLDASDSMKDPEKPFN